MIATPKALGTLHRMIERARVRKERGAIKSAIYRFRQKFNQQNPGVNVSRATIYYWLAWYENPRRRYLGKPGLYGFKLNSGRCRPASACKQAAGAPPRRKLKIRVKYTPSASQHNQHKSPPTKTTQSNPYSLTSLKSNGYVIARAMK